MSQLEDILRTITALMYLGNDYKRHKQIYEDILYGYCVSKIHKNKLCRTISHQSIEQLYQAYYTDNIDELNKTIQEIEENINKLIEEVKKNERLHKRPNKAPRKESK